ncbi:hypothetical protein QF002_007419 [Paraburkholderia youngii]
MQRLERNCRFSFGKTLLCRESAAEAWQCGATLNLAAGSGSKGDGSVAWVGDRRSARRPFFRSATG